MLQIDRVRGSRVRVPVVFALSLFLTGAFWVAETASAQTFGRVVLVIKDEEGNPVKDVKVTVTTKEITNFLEEKTTNKKGRVVVSVTDATRTYDFRIEHGAYPPLDMQIKPALGGTTNREITLSKGGGGGGAAAAPAEGGGGNVVFTPAEKVFNEGVLALQAGDMDTALTNFLQAIEKDPNMILAHSAVAGVYLEQQNYQAALASADKVIELDPENPRGMRFKYEAYKGMGDEENSKKALRQLQRLAPGGDTIKMIFNEGVDATKVGDLKTAKDRFTEVLDLDANFKEAIAALAVIYIKESDFTNAVAMAERVLAIDPNNTQAKRIRYDGYRNLGDEEKAKEAMAAVADADPGVLIKEFFQTGIRQFEAGDVAGAIDNFKQVLELDPNHARAHYRMGISSISNGDNPTAKVHLEKFLELAPNDPEAGTARDMIGFLE